MKEQHILFLIVVLGVVLGLLANEWNSYQWCRMEECVSETKWLCNRINNLEKIHWIVISILVLLGVWKLKEML